MAPLNAAVVRCLVLVSVALPLALPISAAEPIVDQHVEILLDDGGFIRGVLRQQDEDHWYLERLRQGAHGVVRMQVVVPVASMLGWQAGDDLHLNAMPSVSATAGVSAQVLNQPGAKQHSSSPPRPHRRYIGRTAEVVEVPLLSAEEHGL